MVLALTIVHVIIALALMAVVLLQHGKQQGLSGAIAGGAETFFGKNKGRTVDAMLKKFTAVIAILFIITSIALAAATTAGQSDAATEVADDAAVQETITLDENGNLVDANGNILATASDMEAAAAAEAEATGAETAEDVTTGETETATEAEAEVPAAE